MIRRFAFKHDAEDVIVIGHYVVRTPPPEEKLPMPAIAIIGRGVTVAMKWDFGATSRWPREWTLSIRRRSPYLGPTFGLFDPDTDLRGEANEGLGPNYVWGPYRENPAEFTCEVEDEWDVAALLRDRLVRAVNAGSGSVSKCDLELGPKCSTPLRITPVPQGPHRLLPGSALAPRR
jgi:hypothetical protein